MGHPAFTATPNESAEQIRLDSPLVSRAVETLVARAGRVAGERAAEETRVQLERRLQAWKRQVDSLKDGARLGYKGKKDGTTRGLLLRPTGQSWDDWTILNSLRNVEPMVGLIMAGDGLGGER